VAVLLAKRPPEDLSTHLLLYRPPIEGSVGDADVILVVLPGMVFGRVIVIGVSFAD